MKRVALIILTLFLLFINISADAAQKYTKKTIKAVSSDGFNINATLTYPKIKTQKEFKTVVLLHSLGYNSQWWGNLPQLLLDKNFAVLTIDLRGHGKSVYDSTLERVSWKSLKNSGYAKYPEDVLIDDQENNITEWERAGAKGILYKDYSDLKEKILKLKLLYKGRT